MDIVPSTPNYCEEELCEHAQNLVKQNISLPPSNAPPLRHVDAPSVVGHNHYSFSPTDTHTIPHSAGLAVSTAPPSESKLTMPPPYPVSNRQIHSGVISYRPTAHRIPHTSTPEFPALIYKQWNLPPGHHMCVNLGRHLSTNSPAGRHLSLNSPSGRHLSMNSSSTRHLSLNSSGGRHFSVNTTPGRHLSLNTSSSRHLSYKPSAGRSVPLNPSAGKHLPFKKRFDAQATGSPVADQTSEGEGDIVVQNMPVLEREREVLATKNNFVQNMNYSDDIALASKAFHHYISSSSPLQQDTFVPSSSALNLCTQPKIYDLEPKLTMMDGEEFHKPFQSVAPSLELSWKKWPLIHWGSREVELTLHEHLMQLGVPTSEIQEILKKLVNSKGEIMNGKSISTIDRQYWIEKISPHHGANLFEMLRKVANPCPPKNTIEPNPEDGVFKKPRQRPRRRRDQCVGQLWEFIVQRLYDPSTSPSVICWEDKSRKLFRIVDTEKIARLWGEHKGNTNMTYANMSRTMRYYDKGKGAFVRDDRKRVYGFGPKAKVEELIAKIEKQ